MEPCEATPFRRQVLIKRSLLSSAGAEKNVNKNAKSCKEIVGRTDNLWFTVCKSDWEPDKRKGV
jgi:hypothetical protein